MGGINKEEGEVRCIDLKIQPLTCPELVKKGVIPIIQSPLLEATGHECDSKQFGGESRLLL
jgi:hypothetical protein